MKQNAEVSDASAVQNILAGRQEDFAILVHRYLAAMEGIAYSTTGSYPDAEDIAQESMVQAYRYLDRLKEPSRFGAWLTTIAKNLSRKCLAKRAKQKEIMTPVPEGVAPVSAPEQRELHAFLRHELGKMDAIYRDVLMLHYFSGMTAKDIAKVLAVSRNSVLKRLERGRYILGQQLVATLGDELGREEKNLHAKATRILSAVAVMKVPWATAAGGGTAGVLGYKTLSGIIASKVGISGTGLAAVLILVSGAILAVSNTLTAKPIEQKELSAGKSIAADQPVHPTEKVAPKHDGAVVGRDEEQPANVSESSMALPGTVKPAALIQNALPAGYPGAVGTPKLKHTVKGMVFGPDGKVLTGANVWIARAGTGVRNSQTQRSDAEGRFAFKVPDGQWVLRAAKGRIGGEARLGSGGEFIVEDTPRTIHTAIQTTYRSMLHGRVLDKHTAMPLPNAIISADNYMVTESDAAGCFTIEGVEQGDHEFVIACPGYEREYVVYSTALREEGSLEVFLKPGGTVSGVITDAQGHPIPHAWVWAPHSGTIACLQGYYELCDENGRFRYDGLPLDRESTIEALWPCYINTCGAENPGSKRWEGNLSSQHPSHAIALQVPGGPVKEYRMCENTARKASNAVIHGRVLDPHGNPLRQFNIRLRLPRPSLPGDAIDIHHGNPGVRFTSEDGRFAVSPSYCRPGQKVVVQAHAEGFRDVRLEDIMFQNSELLRSSGSIVLQLRETVSLKVQVVNEKSRPQSLEGIRVVLADPDWNVAGEVVKTDRLGKRFNTPQYAYTDARGVASFDSVMCPDALVAIDDAAYATTWTRWDGRKPSVNIVLEGAGVVEGIALAADGGLLESLDGNVPVVCLKGTLDGVFEESDPLDVWRECALLPENGGRFRIDGLPPRHYELSIGWVGMDATLDAPAFKGYHDVFSLEAGQVIQLRYPEDDVQQHPDRLFSQEAMLQHGADIALRDQLLGTWTRTCDLPDGSCIYEVQYFGADGVWQCVSLRSATASALPTGEYQRNPAYSTVHGGWFTIVGGTVHMYDEVRGETWFPEVRVDDNTFQVPGDSNRSSIDYRRAQDYASALRAGEEACGVRCDTGIPAASANQGYTRQKHQGGYGFSSAYSVK